MKRGRLRAELPRFGTAAGGAQGGRQCRKSDGGAEKKGRRVPMHVFLPRRKRGRVLLLRAGGVAGGRSAELRFGRAVFFSRAKRDVLSEIGDVPDRGPGSRAVRRPLPI